MRAVVCCMIVCSVWFATYKSENPWYFAIFSTIVGIVFVLLEASGLLDKLFKFVLKAARRCRAAKSVRATHSASGDSLSMELINTN